MALKKNVVLISHSVHADIGTSEMRAALPARWAVCGIVDVRPTRMTLEESRYADWTKLARAQRVQWEQELKPLLERHHPCSIAYFGLAPIPLAFHLGSLTEGLLGLHPFLRHHETGSWKYQGGAAPRARLLGRPRDPTRATEPVLVTVSTTLPVDIEAARAVVGPTTAEIHVETERMGDDVLTTEKSVHAVAKKFREALQLVEGVRPNASEVHFRGARPCRAGLRARRASNPDATSARGHVPVPSFERTSVARGSSAAGTSASGLCACG